MEIFIQIELFALQTLKKQSFSNFVLLLYLTLFLQIYI